MKKELTKSEIIYLFYGDQDAVLEPNNEWKLQIQQLGLNPDNYVYDKQSQDVVNIYELYNALTLSENSALKESVALYKSKIYGNIKLSDFMIAPDDYDFYGSPQNRDEAYYIRKILKSEWANTNFLEYARIFAQGDTKQPLNTEELIKIHCSDKKNAIDEKTLRTITKADISIPEWERAMALKDMIFFQSDLNKKVPQHKLIYITEIMPRKFMYGQCIIFNRSTNKFLKDNVWIDPPQ